MNDATTPRPMDGDDLALHVMGVSMHLEETGASPLGALHLNDPLVVPGSGWGQVARVTGRHYVHQARPPVWWVAVVVGEQLPGAPVWVWLSDGEDENVVLQETTVGNLGKYGTPLQVLLGKALPVLHNLATGAPVVPEQREVA